MHTPYSSRLQRLAEKRDAIAAQMQHLEREQKAAERKLATRRKILIGATVEADPDLMAIVRKMLDEKLSRPAERALFDLPERTDSAGAGSGADEDAHA